MKTTKIYNLEGATAGAVAEVLLLTPDATNVVFVCTFTGKIKQIKVATE